MALFEGEENNFVFMCAAPLRCKRYTYLRTYYAASGTCTIYAHVHLPTYVHTMVQLVHVLCKHMYSYAQTLVQLVHVLCMHLSTYVQTYMVWCNNCNWYMYYASTCTPTDLRTFYGAIGACIMQDVQTMVQLVHAPTCILWCMYFWQHVYPPSLPSSAASLLTPPSPPPLSSNSQLSMPLPILPH